MYNLNIKKDKFNYFFKLYLVFLGVLGVYHLFFKHTGGLDSTISEWMINYRGGFSRRGLPGEIFIYLSIFFDQSLRFIIYIFQSFLYLIFLTLTFYFFKNSIKNYLMLLMIYCPLFLIYHIAELEILARKELIIFIHFYIYLFILEKKINFFISSIYLFITLPLLGLSWEPIIFFLPFYLFLSWITYFKKIKFNYFFLLIVPYLPFFLVIGLIITNNYSDLNEKQMCQFLREQFNENCYMSLGYLDTSLSDNFNSLFRDIKTSHIIRYCLVIIIGFFPIILIIKNSKLRFSHIKIKLLNIFLLFFVPILVLYMMGLDWGRWTNISYFFYITTFIYLSKIDMVKINFENLKKIEKKYIFNKNIAIVLFIIFCFGWNTKTLYRGDIASLPGYRVPYFFFKNVLRNLD